MSTFIYTQNVDCGLAPCVHRGVWSLALCKPAIRRRAGKGDFIIAVSPTRDGHRLSSWAQIEDRIPTATFYTDFPAVRPDNIYQPIGEGQFVRHAKVKHGLHWSDWDLAHDLGKSGKSAWVLISSDFYSFGRQALPLGAWTAGRDALRRVVDALGRPTRRYFSDAVEADLTSLESFLRESQSRYHNRPFTPREPKFDISCATKKEDEEYSVCSPRRKAQL